MDREYEKVKELSKKIDDLIEEYMDEISEEAMIICLEGVYYSLLKSRTPDEDEKKYVN